MKNNSQSLNINETMNIINESSNKNNNETATNCSLVERLQKENYEQFLTLVRMHLSFVVDINTDDSIDGSSDKPRQFRWGFNKKSRNTPTSAPNTTSVRSSCDNFASDEEFSKLYEIIDFLAKDENVKQEGIFRRTGSLSRQQELKQQLACGGSLSLDCGRFSVHDCASVLKGYLADLPQPLLMDQHYQTYCTLAAQYPPNGDWCQSRLLTALQLLLLLLSRQHRSLLKRLFSLLNLTATHEASNRMSPDTLATMFTPHLLCPRKLPPEALHSSATGLAPLVSFMIRQSCDLFSAPPQLTTDVAAYFTMRARRRALSPTGDLDESISDRCAASTVFTFVDRQRSSAESESNPTDTALAQLYAHIQALPDSQHKRRLVKQFNRQNGYGTPIQIQRTGKAAGSKSLGESIKKHIFNKGLLNKTPKKSSNPNIILEESIMTPRSRKPLIITTEQRDASLIIDNQPTSEVSLDLYGSPKNDSDFVSSEESHQSNCSNSSDKYSNRETNVEINGLPRTSHEMSPQILQECKSQSLTDPFREYLLSRSILTAAPVDLSLMNKSEELTDNEITNSLMFCLDGNVPEDLSASQNRIAAEETRSPLRDINNIELAKSEKSPRKRSAERGGCFPDETDAGCKKMSAGSNEKENDVINMSRWETDL